MAQADLMSPGAIRVAAPKPRMTIYFALLIISLVALLAGCLFLCARSAASADSERFRDKFRRPIPSELYCWPQSTQSSQRRRYHDLSP